MNVKTVIALAISGLFAASLVYATPALADDDSTSSQAPAEMQNSDTNSPSAQGSDTQTAAPDAASSIGTNQAAPGDNDYSMDAPTDSSDADSAKKSADDKQLDGDTMDDMD